MLALLRGLRRPHISRRPYMRRREQRPYLDHPLLPASRPVDYPHIVDCSPTTRNGPILTLDHLRALDGICTILCTQIFQPNLLEGFLGPFRNIDGQPYDLLYTYWPAPIYAGTVGFTVRRSGNTVMAAFFDMIRPDGWKHPDVYNDDTLKKVLWGYWHILRDGAWLMVTGGNGIDPPEESSDYYEHISQHIGELLCKHYIFFGGGKDGEVLIDRYPTPVRGLPICSCRTWFVKEQVLCEMAAGVPMSVV